MTKAKETLTSTCPNCGRTVPAAAKFCPFCGANLSPLPTAASPKETSRPTTPIRVLIVDDFRETRENLKSLVARDPDLMVVGEASDGPEAIAQCEHLSPDVVSMDINMPTMDGITATKEIRARSPNTRVVIVTIQNEADYVRRAMLAGASDYLSLPVTGSDYIATLKRVAQLRPTIPTPPPEPPDEDTSQPPSSNQKSARLADGQVAPETLLLIETAIPEIYRRNPFHILRVSVGTSAREVKRALEKLELENGLAATDGEPGIREQSKDAGNGLTISLERGTDTASAAFQRLGNPDQRLVDEFFWFWPHSPGADAEDKALQAVRAGNTEAAIQTWVERESRRAEHSVATHNLAVVYHMAALELELTELSGPGEGALSPSQLKLRDSYWTQAYERWTQLLTRPAFWRRLSKRVEALDDPRLTSDDADRLQKSLPFALFLINARLAVRFGEQRRREDVRRQVGLLSQLGLPGDKGASSRLTLEESTRQARVLATQPLRDRLAEARKRAEVQAEADPRHADVVAASLLDNPDFASGLETLDDLFAYEDPVRQGFCDDLAEQIHSALVAFGNKAEQWDVVVPLLRRALEIATGTHAREKIQQGLDIAIRNAETDLQWRRAGYWELPEPNVRELEKARNLVELGDFNAAVQALENLYKTRRSDYTRWLVGRPLALSLSARAYDRMGRAFKTLENRPSYLISDADRQNVRNALTSSGNDIRRALEVDPGNRSIHDQYDSLAELARKGNIYIPSKPRGARPGVGHTPPVPDSSPPSPVPSRRRQPEEQPTGKVVSGAVAVLLALATVVCAGIGLVVLVATMSPPQPPTPVARVNIAATSTVASTRVPTPTALPPSATLVPLEAFVAPNLGRANLRSGPGKDYAVLVSLESGTRVEILAAAADGIWLFVDAPSEGVQGWMSVGVLSTTADLASVPTIEFASPTIRPSLTSTSTPTRRPTSTPTRTPTRRPTATRTRTAVPAINVTVHIVNNLSVTITIRFTGPVNRTVIVGAFDSEDVYLAAGTYRYRFTAPGYDTQTGTKFFPAGSWEWTWSPSP